MAADNRFDFLATRPVRAIEDVMETMQSIEEVLPETNLKNLGNFNRAYLIITRRVYEQLKQEKFEDPEFLRRFDVRFAKYYFQALWNYTHEKQASLPWRETFRRCQEGKLSPIRYMALGVNAHVNNDIPLTLKDCGAGDEHNADYRLVNQIIQGALPEIIESLDKDTSPINPKNSLISPAYQTVMDGLIRVWRQDAWNNYLLLLKGELSVQGLEQLAGRKAKEIPKLPF